MKKIAVLLMLAMLFLTACKKEDPASSLKLTSLKECRESYEQDTNQLRKGTYPRLDFSNCEFAEFPDCESVHVFLTDVETLVGVDEGIEIIRQCLEDMGHTDLVDLEKELRDVSGKSGIEWDLTQEGPYKYPSVFEHKDQMVSGGGFLINTQTTYIQIIGCGIAQMSDGTIAKELGTKAAKDAFGPDPEDIVCEGSLESLAEESYELLSGRVKIGDAAKMAEKFMGKGTPYKNKDEKVSEEICFVSVFKINDRFGYDFRFRRLYDDVPFIDADWGGRTHYGPYYVNQDIKHAYVATDQRVSAYNGYVISEGLKSIRESNSILSLMDAAEYLSGELAAEMSIEVESVGLVYCPVEPDNGQPLIGEDTVHPAWEFHGIIKNNGKDIHIYVDVLTKEIFMVSLRD